MMIPSLSETKRLFALVMPLVLIWIAPSKAEDKVLFINPGFSDKGFWQTVTATMQAACDDLGFKLTVVSADRDWEKMLHVGKTAILEHNPDFLILVNENQRAPALLTIAAQKNIPTLLLLNDLTPAQKEIWGHPGQHFPNWIGSLTPDNKKAGLEMMRKLRREAQAAGLDSDGSLALLTLAGDDSTPASLQRLDGVDAVLAESPTLQEVNRHFVNWSRRNAYQHTRKILLKNQLDVVWAANDPIAFGAIDALIEAGKIPGQDVFVSGLNWSPQALQAVINGQMSMTHGGHFLAGAWAIITLADYKRRGYLGKNQQHIHFEMSALQKPLAKRYYHVFGDSDWSKIDFKQFLLSNRPNAAGYDFSLGRLLRSVKK